MYFVQPCPLSWLRSKWKGSKRWNEPKQHALPVSFAAHCLYFITTERKVWNANKNQILSRRFNINVSFSLFAISFRLSQWSKLQKVLKIVVCVNLFTALLITNFSFKYLVSLIRHNCLLVWNSSSMKIENALCCPIPLSGIRLR